MSSKTLVSLGKSKGCEDQSEVHGQRPARLFITHQRMGTERIPVDSDCDHLAQVCVSGLPSGEALPVPFSHTAVSGGSRHGQPGERDSLTACAVSTGIICNSSTWDVHLF